MCAPVQYTCCMPQLPRLLLLLLHRLQQPPPVPPHINPMKLFKLCASQAQHTVTARTCSSAVGGGGGVCCCASFTRQDTMRSNRLLLSRSQS